MNHVDNNISKTFIFSIQRMQKKIFNQQYEMSDFILFWIVVSFLSILWKKNKNFFLKHVLQQKFTTCQIKKLKKEKNIAPNLFFGSFFSFWENCEILLENLILAKTSFFPLFFGKLVKISHQY